MAEYPATNDQVYWFSRRQVDTVALKETISADVAIVGGGMAGLSCALQLYRLGLKVVVLEKDVCGGGATGKSSGFITPDSEMSLSQMVDRFGEDGAKKLWGFVSSGVEQIRKNIDDFALPCDSAEQDCLVVANSQKAFATIQTEHETRVRLGFESRLYTKPELLTAIVADNYFGGVRYGQTFSLDAFAYAQELKLILQAAGVQIFEKTEVTSVHEGRVITPGGEVRARHVVVCTDRSLPDFQLAASDIYSAQTFLGLTKPLTDTQVAELFPHGQCLVWDTDLVYNYFRLTPDNRLLVGGSSLLYTYVPTAKQHSDLVLRKMYTYLEEKLPQLQVEIEYFWPGLIGTSKDFLPVIGTAKDKPNVHFIGGATGLPWAAALGEYMGQRIVSGRSDFDAEFSPDRKFVVSDTLQKIIGKPAAFAISQGIRELL